MNETRCKLCGDDSSPLVRGVCSSCQEEFRKDEAEAEK